MPSLPTSNLGKVLHFPGKIFKALNNLPIVPTMIEVHPTQICNQACPHCVGLEADKTQKRESISFEDFKNKIHDPYECLNLDGEEQVKALSFSGETGDPLVCPDFFHMLDYTRIPFIIITNNYGKIDPLMLKADGIRISLDSVDADKYAALHGLKNGAKALARVFQNARQLMQWKQEKNTATSIGFGFLTGSDTSEDEIRRAINIAGDVGVDYINFRPFHSDQTSLNDIREKILQEKFPVSVLFSDKYTQIASAGDGVTDTCFATAFLMVIASDLNVFSCCHFTGFEKFSTGSLAKTTLEEIIRHNPSFNKRFPNPACVKWCRGFRINTDIENIQEVSQFDPFL
ncbi:radical SAM/SPASM domain-containing protein [Planctomycetota bacterium]